MEITLNYTTALLVSQNTTLSRLTTSSIPRYNDSSMKNFTYSQKTCSGDSVALVRHHQHFESLCITSPMTECKAYFFNKNCTLIYLIILSVQAIFVFFGIILNGVVCLNFWRRRAMRKKMSNVLLVNQALADLFHCIIYACPATAFKYFITIHKVDQNFTLINKEYQHFLQPICDVMALMSISSSIMIYTIVAFERWLSIVKSLWHHAYLRTRHLWNSVIIAWFISFSGSILVLFVDGVSYVIYIKSVQALMVILVALITTLFFITWYKAMAGIRRHRRLKTNSNNTRRQLLLTKIFLIMYLLFMITFTPLAAVNPNKENPLRRIKFLLFTLTAVVNPLLTLTLKNDFKFRSRAISVA